MSSPAPSSALIAQWRRANEHAHAELERARAECRLSFEPGEDGYPVQYRGAAASSPGLYFTGLPFLHSFASMLIAGSARDAARVARDIVRERAPQLAARRDEVALATAP